MGGGEGAVEVYEAFKTAMIQCVSSSSSSALRTTFCDVSALSHRGKENKVSQDLKARE